MHKLIASPFLGNYIAVRPGYPNGMKIPPTKYEDLTHAAPDDTVPVWLARAVHHAWDLDIFNESLSEAVLIRPQSQFGYGRASYELNLGCNYDCEHCYLGLKRFDGLTWPDRERLLHIMRDAGVLWLQLTGGEP
ncbi:MAG: hypothetical protein ACRDRS_24495, partial [Pseudonocardiaceae bacterium]